MYKKYWDYFMMRKLNYFIALILIFSLTVSAQELSFNNWLVLGSIKITFKDIEKTLKPNYLEIDKLIPDTNNELNINGNKISWVERSNFKNIDNNYIVYAGAYFTNENFANVKFTLKTKLPFELYLNGALKISEYKLNKEEAKPHEFNVSLEAGKHKILIKSLTGLSDFDFTITAKPDSNSTNSELAFTTDPTRYVNFGDLLDNPKVKSISVSPNGKYALLNISQRNKSKNGNDTYYRIFNLKENNELVSYRGLADLSSLQFSDNDDIVAYTKNEKNGTNLYLLDLKTGSSKIILTEIKNFSSFTWSPNGKYIIYSIKYDKPANTTGLKKYNNMTDRYPWSNSYELLFYVDIESGFTYRLTEGNVSTDLNSISPDGKYLIYSINEFIHDKRPYSKTVYYLLNIENLQTDSLFTMYWGGTAKFSPDGKKISITGGPTEFNNLGLNVPMGMIANDYDTQLYIYNLETKTYKACSKDFNPSISSVFWTGNNTIYVNTTDRTEEHVYRYDLNKNSYTLINLDVSTISSIDFDKNGSVVVYSGAKVNVPAKVFVYNLIKDKNQLLFEPEAEQYKYIKLGKVEDFSFKASNGKTIEGFLHYPVNYNPSKTYPCIVYYYGGTTPVEKEFEGRYPKNIWAANGYFVYVLEPSGCIGYGQEHSAYHVNDWGTITAQEIIDGTNALLKEYKNIDPKRLGCIGASYGGFMTMNLLTKTDMFAAAVSHAGISALSSYWGNGYWGYTYSAVATANSFPWNRKDIYVNNSALFSADKINTPLLLLHGNSDTNVPPGESMQMYTALKLLGKDVELIEVDSQDHHILDYDKRLLWSKTILAYFDKYLKSDNSWWKFLYK
jgi:dipeptidyl aminopeptidase/acylaminoacyl peptidase